MELVRLLDDTQETLQLYKSRYELLFDEYQKLIMNRDKLARQVLEIRLPDAPDTDVRGAPDIRGAPTVGGGEKKDLPEIHQEEHPAWGAVPVGVSVNQGVPSCPVSTAPVGIIPEIPSTLPSPLNPPSFKGISKIPTLKKGVSCPPKGMPASGKPMKLSISRKA